MQTPRTSGERALIILRLRWAEVKSLDPCLGWISQNVCKDEAFRVWGLGGGRFWQLLSEYFRDALAPPHTLR